ncbi:MAG TPA: stage III sporulation protein AA [Limnochordia bacterium]|nr:stage III sporulation protein AA [Limnochordia bacterium]
MTDEALWRFLPERLAHACAGLAPGERAGLEEIRLRRERPFSVAWGGREHFLDASGRRVGAAAALRVDARELDAFIERLTRHSVYAWQEELRAGFVTLPGGHRVGLAGEVVAQGGRIVRIGRISQVNIRRSRAAPGCARKVAPRLRSGGGIASTLILSPPGCGKTTLLRDLCRLVSDGDEALGIGPCTVGLVDERGEIAAEVDGVPQHDVGARTDVLSRAPKAEGLRLLLRGMGPQLVMTDEIGGGEDAEALLECSRAGVAAVASVHAAGLDDLYARPSLRLLLREGAFARAIVLSRRLGPGTVEAVAVLKREAKPVS